MVITANVILCSATKKFAGCALSTVEVTPANQLYAPGR
jgi:hypothetical protein